MRRFPRWNEDGIGCKGGSSRNAGKTAAVYEFTATEDMPVSRRRWEAGAFVTVTDILSKGTTLRVRKFNLTAPELKAWPWLHDGKWHMTLSDGSFDRDSVSVIARRVQ